jgi:hypothetical protein
MQYSLIYLALGLKDVSNGAILYTYASEEAYQLIIILPHPRLFMLDR